MSVLLRDGSRVGIRSLAAGDTTGIRDFLGRVSPASLGLRFCGMADLERAAEALLRIDPVSDLALVAVDAGRNEIVAHAVYLRLDGRRAEVAFLVADDWQGRGISTVLLERLTDAAHKAGIATLIAEVLPENEGMIALLRGSGHWLDVRGSDELLEFELRMAA